MSAFTIASELAVAAAPSGALKTVVFTATGPSSYDTGGSVLNLSRSGVLGVDAGFTAVHGVRLIGVAAAASDRYHCTYVRAAAGAAATGLIKVRDLNTTGAGGTDGVIELGSTADISALTFIFEAVGV
jgi:hypothetical protein